MLKVYRRRTIFKIDNKVVKIYTFIPKIEEEHELEYDVYEGDTFNGLWTLKSHHILGTAVPVYLCEKEYFIKRRIAFYGGKDKTWYDNGSKRHWELIVKEEEVSVSLEEILKMKDSKLAIQYLKEQGLEIKYSV